ncbi:MAG: glutaredoxin 3 [Coxiella sp. RIFCSPHIGHO2_12_FULL_44_14]|nr:MAG: glutaredoxin 3 [Coxiella sp. RIFCSPHIGHO2_12_FULL_44_14]
MPKVEIYTTPTCSYCLRAKALLDRKKVSYVEIRVDQDPQQRAIMIQRSGGQRTVPQIFINDQWIGGFDELWSLEQQHQLDSKLTSSTEKKHG